MPYTGTGAYAVMEQCLRDIYPLPSPPVPNSEAPELVIAVSGQKCLKKVALKAKDEPKTGRLGMRMDLKNSYWYTCLMQQLHMI